MLLMFFLSVWAIAYNALAGTLFDQFGPTMPFKLISALDLLMCVSAIILGFGGYLNYPNEETSKKEDGDFIRIKDDVAIKLSQEYKKNCEVIN